MHCLLSHPIAVNFSRLISALVFTVIVTKEQQLCLWLIIKAIRWTDWFGGLDVNQVNKGHVSAESDRGSQRGRTENRRLF